MDMNVALQRESPAAPVFRPGTSDAGVWKCVVGRNEYMICDRFEPDDVIVDVGVHIGSFSFLALQRGAGVVWGFEADEENFRQASQNLGSLSKRIRLINAAVCRSDNPPEVMYFGGYPPPHPSAPEMINTGGGSVLRSNGGKAVPAKAFDSIIEEITAKEGCRVRLLKLDCEGSEFPILMTSQMLYLVDEIVGEFHAFGGEDIPATTRIAGYSSLNGDDLAEFLRHQGFVVRMNGRSWIGGHFWAWNRQWLARFALPQKGNEVSL
jgi:FkbM family methyltransferase